jgi:putative colanic acid biosynthesis UDP-glucose lipid carrier transferase
VGGVPDKRTPFFYMHLLMALIALVVFQMIGGVTDFYRSWRGVKITTELLLLIQNWTLSLIFSAGLVAFSHDFDTRLVTYLCWYVLTSLGMVVCRSRSATSRAGCVTGVTTPVMWPLQAICR